MVVEGLLLWVYGGVLLFFSLFFDFVVWMGLVYVEKWVLGCVVVSFVEFGSIVFFDGGMMNVELIWVLLEMIVFMVIIYSLMIVVEFEWLKNVEVILIGGCFYCYFMVVVGMEVVLVIGFV